MKVLLALVGAGLISVCAAKADTAPKKTPVATKPAVAAKSANNKHTPRTPLIQTGVASVYCFRNGPTASGERSRPALLAAAHKTLPFGTLVEVTNRKNGRAIAVRIIDRGPFIEGRIIDLTPAAARALKMDGLADVTVRVLDSRRDLRLVARAN